MAATIKDSFNRLIEYFKEMEKKRRNRFIILTASALAVIIAVSLFLSRTTYAMLYTGMETKDAGEVMEQLNSMGVKAKAQGSDTILVDSSVVDEVRMRLAQDGYPKTGVNYEIYEKAGGLGSTEQDSKIYYQYQTQEFIRASINSMEKVIDSIVLINFAEDSVFVLGPDKKPATASVTLKLQEGAVLSDREVRAVYELVSKAVPGLDVTEITIVDTKMNYYELNDGQKVDISESMGVQLSLQEQVQKRLQEQVVNLLDPVFGKENLRAEVHVTLNFNTEAEQSVVFAPPVAGSDSGLAISLKELYEVVRSDGEGDVTGFSSNGATSADQYQEVLSNEDAIYSQVSREVNYELNETRTQIEKEKGRISDLSVAVVINSTDNEDDYTENVQNLVANAIGVNASRISVEMLPFREITADPGVSFETQAAEMESIRSKMHTAELIRTGIIVVTIIIVLVILLLIVRTLRRPAVPGPGEEGVEYYADEELIPTTDEALAFLEREDTNLAQLEDYIEKSPESVAQLLRNWLSDDSGR